MVLCKQNWQSFNQQPRDVKINKLDITFTLFHLKGSIAKESVQGILYTRYKLNSESKYYGQKYSFDKYMTALLIKPLFPMRPERDNEGRRELAGTRMCK